MFDPSKLGEMMQQAQAMQQKMQAELAAKQVTGSAGGGLVEITLNGRHEVQALKIDPSIVKPDDVAMLEDLVRAAFNDAAGRLQELMMKEAGNLAAQLGLPPGMVPG
jgi:DNA-binding YbaB/EbfC family protein